MGDPALEESHTRGLPADHTGKVVFMCIGKYKGVPTYFSSSQFYADSKYAYVHVSILWSRWNIVQKLKLSTRYGLLQFLALTPTFAVGPMWRTLVSFRCKYMNISWTSGYLEDTSWTFLLPGGKVVTHWEQKREALALLPCRQPGKNHIFSFFITWRDQVIYSLYISPHILSLTRCSNIFSHSPNKSPVFCLQVTSHLGNLVERERAMTKLVNNGPEEHLDLVEKMQKGLKVRRSDV